MFKLMLVLIVTVKILGGTTVKVKGHCVISDTLKIEQGAKVTIDSAAVMRVNTLIIK